MTKIEDSSICPDSLRNIIPVHNAPINNALNNLSISRMKRFRVFVFVDLKNRLFNQFLNKIKSL